MKRILQHIVLRWSVGFAWLGVMVPLAWAQGVPDWSVNPSQFQSSMSVTAVLEVDGLASTSLEDQVAAFVGNEVRGVVEPQQVGNRLLFFMTIHANTDGEALIFKAYDATTGRILTLDQSLTFAANSIEGSPSEPYLWTATRFGGSCASGQPDWTIDPASFESTMNVTGALYIVNTRSVSPEDRVAAFVGEEVRGVASPIDVGGELAFFLTVYANSDGEAVTFKAYDAAADQVWGIEEGFSFVTNAIHGLPSEPVRWTASCDANVATEPIAGSLPHAVTLRPNYPNPFNPTTTLAFALPAPQAVRLSVFDLLGREVAVLVDALQPAGEHTVRFEATDLPSGLYFYRLETPTQTQTRQMVLLK